MTRMSDLVDLVWCRTCEHAHIPDIPVTTFRCASNCGFGAWRLDVAEMHATRLPDHIVYPVTHTVEEIQHDT